MCQARFCIFIHITQPQSNPDRGLDVLIGIPPFLHKEGDGLYFVRSLNWGFDKCQIKEFAFV